MSKRPTRAGGPARGRDRVNLPNAARPWPLMLLTVGGFDAALQLRDHSEGQRGHSGRVDNACACIDLGEGASWAVGKNISVSDAPCVLLPDACGGGECCVPIEPLPTQDWRRWKFRADGKAAAGWLPERHVVLRPSVTGIAGPPSRRLVYLDLGANAYNTSISWFRAKYPRGREFAVIAFEASRRFDADYVAHGDVTLHHFAVWTRNGTMQWGNDGAMGRLAPGEQAVGADAATAVATIDLAEFLQRQVVVADYVVIKMDIEGAEYDLVPHLLSTGASRLIDELLVECHTNINSCCRGDKRRLFYHARQLVQRLRGGGVYAHMWG